MCRATRDAIEADKGHFWRVQFRKTFDLLEGKTNRELRRLYQARKKHLRRGTGYDFFWGYHKREQDVMGVLKQLIFGKDRVASILPFRISADSEQSLSRDQPNSMSTAGLVL